jgi:hypothetical protein
VPLAVVAVVRAGVLPFCLRTLLQNDSLQDVSARRDLYMAALHLLRCGPAVCCKHQDDACS